MRNFRVPIPALRTRSVFVEKNGMNFYLCSGFINALWLLLRDKAVDPERELSCLEVEYLSASRAHKIA